MDNIEIFESMWNTNAIGTAIIVTLLMACIVGCSIVVYETSTDTIREVRTWLQERKNKKTKN